MADNPSEPAERPSAPRLPLALAGLSLVLTALTFLVVSTPGGDDAVLFLVAGLWLIVVLPWFAGLVTHDRNQGSRQRWGPWFLVPSILVVTSVVAAAGLPLAIRFELSRPAFEELDADPPGPDALRQVGLYRVCCYEATAFGYQFGVSEGLTTVWGFAYSPNAPPTGPDIDVGPVTHLQEGDYAYRHLSGPWYIWEFKYT